MKINTILLVTLCMSLGFMLAYSKYDTNLEYVYVKMGNFVHCEEIESLNQRRMQIECYVSSPLYKPKVRADL